MSSPVGGAMTGSEGRSPGDGGAAGKVDPTPWKRLHPLSLAANLVPQAWRTGRTAWPLLLALFITGDSLGMQAVELSVLVAFFGATVARTVTHYITLRYRVHGGRFEVRSGLLNRRARALDPARIQNIELVRNLFHRATRLVEVRVETAGDASNSGLLSALSEEEAALLRVQLKALLAGASPPSAPGADDPAEVPTDPGVEPDQVLVEGTALEALAFGLSKKTVGTVAVLTAVGLEVMGRLGPRAADDMAWALRPEVAAPAILLAFALSWGWSGGSALLKRWRFRLSRVGDRLVNEEGLTTRRRVEIPLAKVQLVRADEPFLRRQMGYGTILIETAALGFADGQVRQAEGVVPMVARSMLPDVLAATSPAVGLDPWAATLLKPHPRALYRAIFARFMRSTILAAVLIALFAPWGWAALALLPLAVPVAWLDWRWQGWLVTPTAVITRRGYLRRTTFVIARNKLQSAQVHQTPLMRWHRLGSVVVRVAGSAIALPDIHIDDALAVLEELSPNHAPGSDPGGPEELEAAR